MIAAPQVRAVARNASIATPLATRAVGDLATDRYAATDVRAIAPLELAATLLAAEEMTTLACIEPTLDARIASDSVDGATRAIDRDRETVDLGARRSHRMLRAA